MWSYEERSHAKTCTLSCFAFQFQRKFPTDMIAILCPKQEQNTVSWIFNVIFSPFLVQQYMGVGGGDSDL